MPVSRSVKPFVSFGTTSLTDVDWTSSEPIRDFSMPEVTAATDAIPAGEKPKKLIDGLGRQVLKGGSTVDDGLFTAITAAYANTINKPVLMAVFVLAVAILIFDKPGMDGPLEIAFERFNTTAYSPTVSRGKATVASVMAGFVDFLIVYKSAFVAIVLWMTPMFLKPSNQNTLVAAFGAVIFISMPSLAWYLQVWMSQIFFLFTQLRKPLFKLIILVVCAISLMSYFSTSTDAYSKLLNKKLTKVFGIEDHIRFDHIDYRIFDRFETVFHDNEEYLHFDKVHYTPSVPAKGEAPAKPGILGYKHLMVPSALVNSWLTQTTRIKKTDEDFLFKYEIEDGTIYKYINPSGPKDIAYKRNKRSIAPTFEISVWKYLNNPVGTFEDFIEDELAALSQETPTETQNNQPLVQPTPVVIPPSVTIPKPQDSPVEPAVQPTPLKLPPASEPETPTPTNDPTANLSPKARKAVRANTKQGDSP